MKNPLARVFLFQLVFEYVRKTEGFAAQELGGAYFFKFVQDASRVGVVEQQ
jgi:hypothetical protein